LLPGLSYLYLHTEKAAFQRNFVTPNHNKGMFTIEQIKAAHSKVKTGADSRPNYRKLKPWA